MVCVSCIATWGIAGTVIYFVYSKFFKKCCEKREVMEKDWKKDTVYLYEFPRPAMLPNHSPFCVKLEAFCRLYAIPFEVRFVTRKSSQYGLVPFIELNGEQIADSQLILLHLQKQFHVPELPEKEEAISRAVDRMVDSHTFAIMLKNKFVDHTENIKIIMGDMGAPKFLKYFMGLIVMMFQKKILKRVTTVLGGNFSPADMRMLMNKDLASIAGILGDQKFLMGDKPTWVDCTVFGHLATLYYLPTSNMVKEAIATDYPSLAGYMERTKETIFGAEFERK